MWVGMDKMPYNVWKELNAQKFEHFHLFIEGSFGHLNMCVNVAKFDDPWCFMKEFLEGFDP